MHWVYTVLNVRKVLLLSYAVFVVWSLWLWIRSVNTKAFALRDWFGSLGLVAGIVSAAMFGWFFLYLAMMHGLIAHGSALWLYYYLGEGLAVLGLFLGLFFRGELRQSAAIISVVMMFEWYGEMIVGLKAEAIVSIALISFLMLWTVIWAFIRVARRKESGMTSA
jgi:hypothetical protein